MKLWTKLFGRKGGPLPTLPVGEGKEGELFLLVGALTDRGPIDHNEDALFVLNAALSRGEDLLPLGLYIVADGMGGHEGGQRASDLAVRLTAHWILERIYQPFLLDPNRSAGQQPINDVLVEAAVAANSKVREECPRGGTTLTCTFVLGTNAFIAHVGDTRAYLISHNTIRQITTDHSLVNRLIELGQITPEEALTHPQRNVLYRALGRPGSLEVDTYLQSLPLNSSLLLCSDGLWGVISEQEILSVVNAASSPQVACRQLVALAAERGDDNITAVLVQVCN